MICVHGVLVGLWLVLPIEVCVCVCLIRIARQLRACHKIHIIRLRYEVKKSTKSAFRVFILNQTHTHIHIPPSNRRCTFDCSPRHVNYAKYYEFIVFLVAMASSHFLRNLPGSIWASELSLSGRWQSPYAIHIWLRDFGYESKWAHDQRWLQIINHNICIWTESIDFVADSNVFQCNFSYYIVINKQILQSVNEFMQ